MCLWCISWTVSMLHCS
uniref:Uncharacterized protein n=1 Tax=Arundo donax TaxID=35708 RepID=A0A0A9HLF7_ARUDO